MAKKPSPPTKEDAAEAQPGKDEVSVLRAMSREDRLALLMKDFDATCGVLRARRKPPVQAAPVKPRRKT